MPGLRLRESVDGALMPDIIERLQGDEFADACERWARRVSPMTRAVEVAATDAQRDGAQRVAGMLEKMT